MQTFLAESSFSGSDAKNKAGGEPGTEERARDREGEESCQQQLAWAAFQEDCGIHEKMLPAL